jgi:hypothetical protein
MAYDAENIYAALAPERILEDDGLIGLGWTALFGSAESMATAKADMDAQIRDLKSELDIEKPSLPRPGNLSDPDFRFLNG